MNYVYDYAKSNLWETEDAYPYKGQERDCHHFRDKGYHVLDGYNTYHGQQILEALQKGPVAGSANANSWQFYHSGVFSQCQQGSNPNHGINIVGLDNDLNWIVKNSWGKGWGQNGYIVIKSGNTCGIMYEAFQPYLH